MSPIPAKESLAVELKSDRKRLSDHDLIEAIVGLANAEGGELWLGVEDDGSPTCLHAEHPHVARHTAKRNLGYGRADLDDFLKEARRHA